MAARTVLITGGASGMGAATAREFAAQAEAILDELGEQLLVEGRPMEVSVARAGARMRVAELAARSSAPARWPHASSPDSALIYKSGWV